MGRYSRFLTRFPFVLIIVDILLVAICAPIVYWQHGVPSFGDPTKGMATKGTSIQGRRAAADLVYQDIADGNLTYLPTIAPSRRKRSPGSDPHRQCMVEDIGGYSTYSIVLESTDHGLRDLMTVDMLQSICDFERIHVLEHLDDITEDCRLHSVPYYVAGLQNKTCDQLIQADVDRMNDLLVSCSPYYFNESLALCYRLDQCDGIPPRCFQGHNSVYKILYFLADVNFLSEGASGVGPLTYTQLVFRESWYNNLNDPTETLKNYFLDNLEGKLVKSSNGKVISRAMNLGIQITFQVFDYYVIGDLPYYALAMGLVLFVIILYMRSIVLTILILFTVIFSLLLSYFFYYIVFRFEFFPFMNLLSALLLIAVGADDVFILRDIWTKYAVDDDGKAEVDIEKIVSATLSHGALSIFVTSLTTAAALFANYVSSVTTLKCFSIFAGTCILINFFFMITWVPAVMVIMEKTKRRCGEPCRSCNPCWAKLRQFADKVWGAFFPSLVLKVWPLWLLLFLGIGVGGIVLSFVTPRLTLPKTADLKLFYPGHPLEMYTNDRYKQFQFELDIEKLEYREMEIRILWGVREGDNSNVLNPDDEGHYRFDDDFNPFTQEGQEWLLTFINNLLDQSFIQEDKEYINLMEVFKDIVRGPCTVPLYSYAPTMMTSISPCCDLSFPLNESMAKFCFTYRPFYQYLIAIASSGNATLVGSPIYDKTGTSLKAIIIVVTTNKILSGINNVMENHYKEFDQFIMGEIKEAPRGLDKGWWSGVGQGFLFYDLQKALADGTFIGIGLSLGVGFLVLLFTSMNIFLTAYAIFTIGLAIVSTIGVLVLVGWELGTFESLSITLSVGLSIDFTIHYGIAYKMSDGATRSAKIRESLSTVGFALLMAAITTFLAGSALMGGRVVGYRNFGMFLMTCMTMSWLFATFFFLPLCRFIGPLGNVGNLMYAFKCKCMKVYPESDDNLHFQKDEVQTRHPDRGGERGKGGRRSRIGNPTNLYRGQTPPHGLGSPTHNFNNSNQHQSQYYRSQDHVLTSPRHTQSDPAERLSYYSFQSGRGAVPRPTRMYPMYAGYQPQGQDGLWSLPRLGRTQSGYYSGVQPGPTAW